MVTVFHARLYGRFIEIQSNPRRRKLHRTNQGSNFLGGSFSNRDNVRAPNQFRRKRQPQHLKRLFFLKNRPIHFHINNTSIIRPVKRNQLSFSSIEINKPLPAPVHSGDWHAKSCRKPWIYQVLQPSSPRPVKSRSNSIRYNCQKICS